MSDKLIILIKILVILGLLSSVQARVDAQEITLSLNGPIYTQLDPISYTVSIHPSKKININGLATLEQYRKADKLQVGELQYYSFRTRKWKPMGLYPGMDMRHIYFFNNQDSLIIANHKYYKATNYLSMEQGDTLDFEAFFIPVKPAINKETLYKNNPSPGIVYRFDRINDYYIFVPDSIKIRFKLNAKGRKRYSNELMVRYTESKAFTDLLLDNLNYPFLYTYFWGSSDLYRTLYYRNIDLLSMKNNPSLVQIDSIFKEAEALCTDAFICEYVKIFPALLYTRNAFSTSYNGHSNLFMNQSNPKEVIHRLLWLMQQYPRIESKYLKELILFHLNRATDAVTMNKSEIEAISQFVFFYRLIKE